MIVALYWSLTLSFFVFVVLYLYFERQALRTKVGLGIFMFFATIAVSMFYFAFSHYVDFPGEMYVRLVVYGALNVIGWGASAMLLWARHLAQRSQGGTNE